MTDVVQTSRPYQLRVLAECRKIYREGCRRFVIVMPTGSGKTHAYCTFVDGAVKKGSKALIICPSRETVKQTGRKLQKFGLAHGVIMAGFRGARSGVSVQVASMQTLYRRLDKLRDYLKQFNVIVTDEAHHNPSESITSILDASAPDAILVGATATPERADGRPMGGKLFHRIVQGPQVTELVEVGALVPYDGFTYARPDLSSLKKRKGEYNPQQLDAVMRNIVIGGSVIRDYLEHARGLRGVLFAATVEHSKALVDQALAAGIPAVHVDADTPDEERDALFLPNGKMDRGEVLLVSNVGVLCEGTDVPCIEMIGLCRPIASVGLAMQQWGRGLRPWCFDCHDAPTANADHFWGACLAAGHRVKKQLRLHDHAGLLVNERIGLPDWHREWSLTDEVVSGGEKWGNRTPTTCDKCSKVLARREPKCPNCGHPTGMSADGALGITIDEDTRAQMISIAELREQRATKGPKDAYRFDDSTLKRVMTSTREERCADFLRLQGVAARKGFKPGWPEAEYARIYGLKPTFSEHELATTTPAREPMYTLAQRRRAILLPCQTRPTLADAVDITRKPLVVHCDNEEDVP